MTYFLTYSVERTYSVHAIQYCYLAVLMHEPNKIMKPAIRFILNKFGAFYFQIVEFLFEISWFCIKKGFRKKYKESLSKAYLVVVRIQSVYMV